MLRLDGSAASRPEDGPGRPLTESPWLEPYPDEHLGLADGRAAPDARYELRESVELAFVAALQHLPARQRAVLILREVLGFSAREVAQSLDTTAASVNSALQRARRTVDEALPERSQQATLRSLGDEGLRRLVQRYVEAWESRDVDRMVAVLAEDVTFAMPPFPHWWSGRDERHRSSWCRPGSRPSVTCSRARTASRRSPGTCAAGASIARRRSRCSRSRATG